MKCFHKKILQCLKYGECSLHNFHFYPELRAELFIRMEIQTRGGKASNGRFAKSSQLRTQTSKWERGIKKKLCSVGLLPTVLQNEPEESLDNAHSSPNYDLRPKKDQPKKFFTSSAGRFLANLLFCPTTIHSRGQMVIDELHG